MKIKLILIALFSLLIFSCENTVEDYSTEHDDFGYFPLKEGSSWTYQLDSVIYDKSAGVINTVSGQMKEVVTEVFIDHTGLETFRIARSNFSSTDNTWQITDVWSAAVDELFAYRTEENLRFAKLNFPVTEGRFWDGNAFIQDDIVVKIAGEPIKIYQNWPDYSYEGLNGTETIGNITYEDVVLVSHVDLEDKISRRFSIEKYAKGFGLVYKKMIVLNTQQFDSNKPWEEKAEEGFILEQTLLSFEE